MIRSFRAYRAFVGLCVVLLGFRVPHPGDIVNWLFAAAVILPIFVRSDRLWSGAPDVSRSELAFRFAVVACVVGFVALWVNWLTAPALHVFGEKSVVVPIGLMMMTSLLYVIVGAPLMALIIYGGMIIVQLVYERVTGRTLVQACLPPADEAINPVDDGITPPPSAAT